MESGEGALWRAGADLWNACNLYYRHAGRRPDRPRHRDFPHRTLSAVPAPPDRHCHRTARRHSFDHLWHLGSFRLCPVFAAARSADNHRYARQCTGHRLAVRGPAIRYRRADRWVHPRDHGASLHRLDHARRLRNRAAGAERIRLRSWCHHMGSRLESRSALHACRRDRRRDARARPRARRNDGHHLRHR